MAEADYAGHSAGILRCTLKSWNGFCSFVRLLLCEWTKHRRRSNADEDEREANFALIIRGVQKQRLAIEKGV